MNGNGSLNKVGIGGPPNLNLRQGTLFNSRGSQFSLRSTCESSRHLWRQKKTTGGKIIIYKAYGHKKICLKKLSGGADLRNYLRVVLGRGESNHYLLSQGEQNDTYRKSNKQSRK